MHEEQARCPDAVNFMLVLVHLSNADWDYKLMPPFIQNEREIPDLRVRS